MEGTPDNELVLVFVIAALALLVLSGSIVLFVLFYQKRMLQVQSDQQGREASYQRGLFDAAIQSQESERIRIARELHDSIGAMLSTIKLQIAVMSKSTDPLHKMRFAPLVEELNETIDAVRRISMDLMPPSLEQFGIKNALDGLFRRTQSVGEIVVDFEADEIGRIPRIEELGIFRIAQELLNNAIKHASATEIVVRLRLENDCIVLNFKDNGCGFDTSLWKHGSLDRKNLGIENMKSRASHINAQIECESQLGKGTCTYVILPYSPMEKSTF